MKVALFFDGKNFYGGWRDRTGRQPIDFVKLSKWLVERASGTLLWGAYYYTGIEPDSNDDGQNKLASFLDTLERLPGFFVNRFPRKKRTATCSTCGATNHYTEEKEVDTTMVADMLRLAAVGAFDVLVLMSGDADHSPAVEGVRALGRQAYVATWGGSGLSTRLRKAAFDHIDLLGGLDEFRAPPAAASGGAPPSAPTPAGPVATAAPASTPTPAAATTSAPTTGSSGEDAFLHELGRAEAKFVDGYVGVNYFITKWQCEALDESPEVRRRILTKLEQAGRVEVYAAADGSKALRRK